MIVASYFSETEYFPIEFKAEKKSVWMIWSLAENPKYSFFKVKEELLWAQTKTELISRLIAEVDHPNISEQFECDLDAALLVLKKRDRTNFESVLNAINLLDDLFHSIQSAKGQDFPEIKNNLLLYDELFAMTRCAEILGFNSDEIQDADCDALAAWISSGAKLLLKNTIWSVN